MSTVVIADDDLITLKNIFNYIIQKNNGIKVLGLTSDGTEVLKYIDKYMPDILLLDLMMPKLNGLDVLDILLENKEKYLKKMKIIIISSYIDKLYKENKYSKYIYEVLHKPLNIDKLVEILNKIDNEKEKIKISQYIDSELNKFMFNKGSNSYKYLSDTIYLVLLEKRRNFELESDIYLKVAKLNNKKSEKMIKWAIEKLLYNMYINTRQEIIKEYFNFIEDTKPTTKLFIRSIVENYNRKKNKR